MYGQRNGGFRPQNNNFAPVKVGEELDVRIEAVGEKGDGIAKKKGFVLFVPNTREGDTVKVRVTKVFSKLGFAEVIGQAQSVPAQEETQHAPAHHEEPVQEEEDLIPEGDDSEDFGEEDSSDAQEEDDSEEEKMNVPPAQEEESTQADDSSETEDDETASEDAEEKKEE